MYAGMTMKHASMWTEQGKQRDMGRVLMPCSKVHVLLSLENTWNEETESNPNTAT